VGAFAFNDGVLNIIACHAGRIDNAFSIEGVPKENSRETENVVEWNHGENVRFARMQNILRFFRHIDGSADLIAEGFAIGDHHLDVACGAA